MSEQKNRTIVFVCTGNICRSPMAECIFRARIGPDAGWKVLSAGTFAMDGQPASQHSAEAVAEWGMDLSHHRSRMLTPELAAADLVVTMTEGHRQDILSAFGVDPAKVYRLGAFSSGEQRDIMDPIGGSLSVYRKVRDQINSGVSDLVLWMMDQGLLSSDRE